MTARISVLEADLADTWRYLLGRAPEERAGFWICGLARLGEGHHHAVREFIPVPEESLERHASGAITVSPVFTAEVLRRCRTGEGLSIFVLHSHPGSHGGVAFSRTDWDGERALLRSAYARVEGGVHGAVVFGDTSVAARTWAPDLERPIPVDLIRSVGRVLHDIVPDNAGQHEGEQFDTSAFDRQVRVFGEQGQRRLRRLIVGVVGAGGTGSLTIQQLARLGVGHIIAIDDDVVELTNVPRIVGATEPDVGEAFKVDVAVRHANGLPSIVRIDGIRGNVRDHQVARELRRCDVIFSCVDRHYPRAILNQFAQQYLVPVIDMGVQVKAEADTGRIGSAGGRVAVVRPGDWCLWCTGDISAEEVRREGLSPHQRKAEQERGYVGPDIPAPSVISLNGVVSSLAVTEFLQLVLGFAGSEYGRGRRIYRILDGRVSESADQQSADCFVCRGRFKGLADAASLP
jgi:molybdopterin-synthase adenylyltransferase